MNSAFSLFKLRHTSGANYRESYIQHTKDIIENKFADDPAFRQVEVIGKGSLNIRASNYRKEGFLMPKMDIQATLDNEFFMGDLFFFDNEYWLCTMKNTFYEVYHRGEITQCNNILRFQLPNEYDIYEFFAVIERPFSKNITTGQVVQISDKEYRVRTQLTDITKKIFVKQRFIIGMGYDAKGNEKPDVYTVDSRDSLSNAIMFEEGFLVLNFKEDQYDSQKDNTELMIADYRSAIDILPIIPLQAQIVSPDNKYEIKLGNFSWKLFMGKLFDDKDKEITNLNDIIFEWNVFCDELQEKWIKFDNSEKNIFKIRCNMPSDDNDIDKLLYSTFKLHLHIKNELNNIDYGEFEAIIQIVNLI